MVYSFANCALDIGLYELRRAGAAVPLEPLAFNLLTYLVQHRDRTISKDELIERLWSGQCIGDSSLVQSVVKARRAIGDNGHTQRCIKTITSHGYRFVAPVEEYDAAGQGVPGQALTRIPPEVSSLMTLQAMAPWHGETGPGLPELLAAERLQGEEHQGQTVLLVLCLCRTHTAPAPQDAPCINPGAHALQRCATRPVPRSGSAQRVWKMPGGRPVAGWLQAGAKRHCGV